MRRNANQTPRFMTARFDSVCPETGKAIAKGTEGVYFPAVRKMYHAESKAAEEVRAQEFSQCWGMADANY